MYLLIWWLFCLRLFISSSSYIIDNFGHAFSSPFPFSDLPLFTTLLHSALSTFFAASTGACIAVHVTVYVCVHHSVCVLWCVCVCVNTWPLSLLKLFLPVFALCTLCVAYWRVYFFVIQLMLWYLTASSPTVLWKCWKSACAFHMLGSEMLDIVWQFFLAACWEQWSHSWWHRGINFQHQSGSARWGAKSRGGCSNSTSSTGWAQSALVMLLLWLIVLRWNS